MNKTFRIVWSAARQAFIVAHEKANTHGKPSSVKRGLACGLVGVLIGGAGLAVAQPAANTLPTGGQIVAGQGSISQAGSAMTVTQNTERMIANWNTFNIGQNASVNFVQPGASAVVLNRIFDQNPSQIFGSLTANGQVFLINPAGITFGPTARVDVGGLVAASLNISNENFLAGNYRFESSGAAGAVLNQGQLRTVNGGYLAFISPQVRNEGSMVAPGGTVALAAGDKVSVDFVGDRLVTFTVDQGAVNALAGNKGLIQADGGLVMLTAKAADSLAQAVVNNEGIIEAKGLTEQGGRVLLDTAGGQTTVSGTLDASSAADKGGRVVATGERVLIKDGAHLTASGKTGGGEVLVGGSWQNSDASVRQATGTVIEKEARMEANATDTGNGGTVVAWSDVTNANSVTRAYGTFEAKGGVNGGDGGRIETSGHWLDVSTSPDAGAVNGKGGLWLVDPYNITVVAGGANTNINAGSPFESSGDSASLGVDLINTALGSGDVTIKTGSGGGQAGDIAWDIAYTYTGATVRSLTLEAHRDILLNQSIASNNGALSLAFTADSDSNGTGGVVVKGDLTTQGGNLTFNGLGTIFSGGAAQAISTSGGNVSFNGEVLLANTNGISITTGDGNVLFGSKLDSGNSYTYQAAAKTWQTAMTDWTSGAGGATGSTYLATVTSALEMTSVMAASTANQAWLGGSDSASEGTWRWVAGPEGLEDGGSGRVFWTTSQATGATGYNGYSSRYVNWNGGEPNNSGGSENALQMGAGLTGQWNDLPHNSSILGSVVETNLAASPLTINAGSGDVTFSGAVGSNKALASLNVTSSGTIAINGGTVTTEGLQTYTGNVTLGAASTVLTQTAANTNFTLQNGKSITNASGSDASLIVKTTGAIILDDSSSIASSTGKLNTTLHADSDADGGSILMDVGSAIQSNGGNIILSGGADVATGYAKGAGAGVLANGISLYSAALDSGGGNITLRGASATSFTEGVLGRIAHGVVIGQKTGQAASLVDSGIGKISVEGLAFLQNENGTDYSDGVRIGTVDGNTNNLGIKVTSSSNAADAIIITGNASGSTLATSTRSTGIFNTGTIQNTGGGGVTLNGVGGSSTTSARGVYNSGNILSTGNVAITGQAGASSNDLSFAGTGNIGSASGTDVPNSTGNITLTGNTLDIAAGALFSSTGQLTVAPRTVATTIGVAGGAGTLQLVSSYFATNFTNGFSGITIGSATAGDITVGNTALTYSDPLMLKTAGNILVNSGASLTGASGQNASMALWADGDAANGGYVQIGLNSPITTNGGHLWIGGGSGTTVWNGLTVGDGFAQGTATYGTGVYLGNGTISTAGGDVAIYGKTATNAAGANQPDGTAFHSGIYSVYGANQNVSINAGTGTILLHGINQLTSAVGGEGIYLNGGTLSSAAASGNAITLIGDSSSANYGAGTRGAGVTLIGWTNQAVDINATGGGDIVIEGTSDAVAASGVGLNYGVRVSSAGATTQIRTSNGGNITITGTVRDSNSAYSVGFETANDTINSSGDLSITGTTNNGNNKPIYLAGAVQVSGTSSLTASGQNITATNTGNDFSGVVSVGSGNNVSIVDSNAMTLGAVNAAGTVDIATLSGNLTLTGAVDTSDATANAIRLNAGKNTAAGTAGASDIIVTGGSVSVGAGGFATLYSGSVAGSTGLTALVGSGSGRFRYNSDEADSNYTAALTAGTNAVYRERPTVTVTAADDAKTYDGLAYTGGNGVTYGGFANGDTSALLGGTLSYGGTSQGAINANTYIITPSGLTDTRGYLLAISNGGLTVNKADLTVTADNGSKTYGQTTNFAGTEFTSVGLQNGETIGSVTLGSAGAVATANVAGSPYAITASNATGGTFSTGNYNLSYVNGGLTVNKADLTITANGDTRDYSGSPYSGGNGVVYAGFVNGEGAEVLAGVLTYGGSSQGAINSGSYAIAPGGLGAGGNYQVTFVDGVLNIKTLVPPVEQSGTNGTQETSSVAGTASTPGMGPGSGSLLLASLTTNLLVSGIPGDGGASILASNNASTPINFSSSGQAASLQLGVAAGNAPAAEVGNLPVFTEGAGGMNLQGTFLLKESDASLSLAPAGTGSAPAAPALDAGTGQGAPFTLTLPNGIVQQMTVTLLPSAVLLISVPDSVGVNDVRQVVLMALQVVRQEMKAKLKNVKSVVVRRK